MFTQAMPAFANSMRNGQMFPAMQALGNCQQPLSHRGGVNFAAGPGLNQRGVYTSQPWNPANYQFPGGSQFADFGGMNVNWNSGNRYDSQFFFPTDQFFTQNQFFGGPQVHVDGRVQTDIINANTYEGDTITVNRVTTRDINGDPVGGLPGRPGEAGRDGRPGAPGFPGQPGLFPVLRARNARYLDIVGNDLPTVLPLLQVTTKQISIPTTATLDPGTCEVTLGDFQDHQVVTKVAGLKTPVDGVALRLDVFFGP